MFSGYSDLSEKHPDIAYSVDEILKEIDKNLNKDDIIKKLRRRLANKYHSDTGDNKNQEEKMKVVNAFCDSLMHGSIILDEVYRQQANNLKNHELIHQKISKIFGIIQDDSLYMSKYYDSFMELVNSYHELSFSSMNLKLDEFLEQFDGLEEEVYYSKDEYEKRIEVLKRVIVETFRKYGYYHLKCFFGTVPVKEDRFKYIPKLDDKGNVLRNEARSLLDVSFIDDVIVKSVVHGEDKGARILNYINTVLLNYIITSSNERHTVGFTSQAIDDFVRSNYLLGITRGGGAREIAEKMGSMEIFKLYQSYSIDNTFQYINQVYYYDINQYYDENKRR